MEFLSGTYGTGVFHPDGTEEQAEGCGYWCPMCERMYEESDVTESEEF